LAFYFIGSATSFSNNVCLTFSIHLSGREAAISTLWLEGRVIRASAIKNIEPHLFEIEKQLLKASQSWPKEHLDKLVGMDNHTWVPHQKSKKGGGLITEGIEKWAE
jgi:hypothetical protein